MGRPDLNRRQLLATAGGLAVAGSFGFAALGTGADALASSARTRVRYWNLFQGGDGTNQVAMVDAFRKANPDVAVKDSTLTWGGPYYTKLAMAAAGNRAPDLAVMHQGRIPGFAPGRLLDPWDVDLLAEYGVREADFNPVLWRRGIVDGELYALPLDIHVQLNFYRKDVCEKAGLLDSDGRLPAAGDPDEWFEILKAAKGQLKKGQQTLGLHANDQNFAWWFFVSFYQQLGGTYFDEDQTQVTFDTDKATQVLEFLRRNVTEGYVTVGEADGEAFIAGSPFTWEGNWSVPYFNGEKIEYGAQPLPPVFGTAATHVESHAFVLPHQPTAAAPRTRAPTNSPPTWSPTPPPGPTAATYPPICPPSRTPATSNSPRRTSTPGPPWSTRPPNPTSGSRAPPASSPPASARSSPRPPWARRSPTRRPAG